MADTPHPNPGGLSIPQQDRARREGQFQASVEAHLTATLHRHGTILDRIAATLDALRPRDTPVIVRTAILAASTTAPDCDLAITLPDGINWLLASILPLSEPGASGAHQINIKGLLDDNFMVAFTAGDPQARLDCYLPVPRSMVLRVSDTGAGLGNTLLALRFEPARW